MSNSAFIDGQNLYSGTRMENWSVDHAKFRIYLRDTYNVSEAYYFLGFVNEDNQDLYASLQKAGFILVFREHSQAMRTLKKGNVDTDVVFTVMKSLLEDKLVGNVVLVSGDGDYKKLVEYLIEIGRFEKLLFPNKKFASSLYTTSSRLSGSRFAYLGDVRHKIQYIQK